MVKLIKRRWIRVCILAIIIIVFSMTLFSISNNGKDIKNLQDFIDELKLKGYNVQTIDIPTDVHEYFESSIGHKAIVIKDSSIINLYEFETEELAKSAAETISKDANRVGNTYVHWASVVKFYRKGNIIVQYNGTNFRTLWHLRTIMGKSVASSPIGFLLFEKFSRKK